MKSLLIFLLILSLFAIDPTSGQITSRNEENEVGSLPADFSVTATGAAAYTVPIDIPAGRSGLTPNLAFIYNSHQGGNILGTGWSLSGFSSISRTNQSLYYNDKVDNIDFRGDQLLLDGQYLISVGTNEFRTEIDGQTRIELLNGVHGYYFQVTLRNGTVSEYGNSEDSRQEYDGVEDDGYPLIWHINRTTDIEGNYLVYEYSRDVSNGELYPERICYTGYEKDTLSLPCYYSIEFNYSENLPSELRQTIYCEKIDEMYQNVSSKLLDTIRILYLPDDILLREYSLEYALPDENTETSVCGELFLSKIQLCAQSDQEMVCYNPTTFDWQFYEPAYEFDHQLIEDDSIKFQTPITVQMTRINLLGCNKDGVAVSKEKLIDLEEQLYQKIISVYYGPNLSYELTIPVSSNDTYPIVPFAGDFNCDGDEELIFTDDLGIHLYDFIPEPSGEVDTTSVYSSSLTGKIKIGDLDGDGKTDFLLVNSTSESVSCTLFKGTADPENLFQQIPVTLPISSKEEFEELSDFNGDGKVELLYRDYPDFSYTVYSYNSTSGFYPITYFEFSEYQPYIFPYYTDLNGDGRTDIRFLIDQPEERSAFRRYLTKFAYGNGFTDTIGSEVVFIPQFVMDFNNDKRADFARFVFTGNPASFDISYGMPDGLSSSEVFSTELNWPAYSNMSGIAGLCLADISGNGIQDIMIELFEQIIIEGDNAIKSDADDSRIELSYALLHLYSLADDSHGKDLITKITDGLGSETNVFYIPSGSATETYENYPLSLYTEKNYLVEESYISGFDGNKINRRKYTYSCPVQHKAGKGFLGYKTREIKDFQTGRIIMTGMDFFINNGWYYMPYTAYDSVWEMVDEERGLLLSARFEELAIKALSQTQPPVFRPFISKSLRHGWDNDGGHSFIGTTARFQEIEDIDEYGNSLLSSSFADNGYLTLESSLEQYQFSEFTESTYLNDSQYWIIGRPETVTATKRNSSENNSYTVTSILSYYEPEEAGMNGVKPWPKIKSVKTIPDNDFYLSTLKSYEYDIYGNIVSEVLSAPHAIPLLEERKITFEYDDEFKGRFMTKKTEGTDELPFVTDYNYDETTGLLKWILNPQGLQTFYTYDAFGRMITENPPDRVTRETRLDWSGGHADAPPEAVYHVTRLKRLTDQAQTESEVTLTFFNKLNQQVRTVTLGLHSAKIYNDIKYDEIGRPDTIYEPYFSGNCPGLSTKYFYDLFGRPIKVETPTGNEITTDYLGRIQTTYNTATGVEIEKTVDVSGKVVGISEPTGDISYTFYSSGLVKTIESEGLTYTFEYDAAGNQVELTDPDAGTMNYQYNAFGEIASQTDSRGNTCAIGYDEIGRITDKTYNSLYLTQYFYNEDPEVQGYGLPSTIVGYNNISYSYEYDKISRLAAIEETIDQEEYRTEYEYSNLNGKVAAITYPTELTVAYDYETSTGIMNLVRDMEDNTLLWEAVAANHRGQLTQYANGNNTYTEKTYDAYGFPTAIVTYSSNNETTWLQNNLYDFEAETGNLTGRAKYLGNSETMLEEYFEYDTELKNRLTSWQVDSLNHFSISYSDDGNILNKTGITSLDSSSAYIYGQDAGPHAVTSVVNPDQGYLNIAYPQEITYTPFQKVSAITQEIPPPSDNPGEGIWRQEFTYGPDEERKITRLYKNNDLMKTKTFIGGNLFEIETTTGETSRKLHYIYGGDGLLGIKVKTGTTSQMYYIHKDYLGSYDVVTNQQGQVVAEYSFDPWGRRRNPTNWTYNNVPQEYLFDRGYTGHEHLDVFGLINMNGRVYDPWLGRFLSADPYVQNPGNSQNYNRYSYCLNNPLKYTDPSGYNYLLDLKRMYNYEGGGFYYRGGYYSYNSEYRSYYSSKGMNLGGTGYYYENGQYYYNDEPISYNQVFNNYIAPNSTKYYWNHLAGKELFRTSWLDSEGIKHIDIYFPGGWLPIKTESQEVMTDPSLQRNECLENLQTGLDLAGIVDPTGFIDLGNALIYALRGQWRNAGISALAIIPYIGDAGKAFRLSVKTVHLTSRARTTEQSLELAEKFLKPGYSEIAPGVFRSSDQLRQFRMTTSDITGSHGLSPHFNFEIYSPLNLNKAIKNYHVPIINP